MITLFRKLRLTENRFSKYLLYAIGEIVLVVIGILIAVKVNNLSEEWKNQEIVKEYLVSLQEEFEFNKKSLEKVVRLNDKNATAALAILNYTGPGPAFITDEAFDSLIVNTVGSEVEFRPRNEIIDELLASGKLSLIKNPELRTAITSWPEALKRVRFQEAEVSRARFALVDIAMKHVNIRNVIFHSGGVRAFGITESKFPKKDTQLLKIQEFESSLANFISTSKFVEARYNVLHERLDLILEQTKKELDK